MHPSLFSLLHIHVVTYHPSASSNGKHHQTQGVFLLSFELQDPREVTDTERVFRAYWLHEINDRVINFLRKFNSLPFEKKWNRAAYHGSSKCRGKCCWIRESMMGLYSSPESTLHKTISWNKAPSHSDHC